ncbi:MAG: hypothetical protein AMQ22_01798 [Candidatus Methanofastidiosum methylothiophilum]|jgi:predicted nucleic acid-binding protein|uniref:PIN domain-containing protein n=1 Tax=Candidatus Methanofastidiosum methylothiophilum TaxID=1705564 RepID=A0A150IVA5_9EURY|nr:MAG: hypothetical protein AMQ22_01798 [Candidatus Methanofastidiosum methylthiophilus]
MRIDVTKFIIYNVIDTCSIWNILSSSVFVERAENNGCQFCCTKFVIYESLYKPRKKKKDNDIQLQQKLVTKMSEGKFIEYQISIEDLQDVEVLANRKNLSKGEISSMVFAKKTRQAFLTDDQGARKLSENYIGLENTQTTPQLFGWLAFIGCISEADKELIIDQHNKMDGLLEKHLNIAYLSALEKRLMV